VFSSEAVVLPRRQKQILTTDRQNPPERDAVAVQAGEKRGSVVVDSHGLRRSYAETSGGESPARRS
jgi:hypothetical protein